MDELNRSRCSRSRSSCCWAPPSGCPRPARTSTSRSTAGSRACPGGLIIANILACGMFSAVCGSSPATAAAIGKAGVPEMIRRGVPAVARHRRHLRRRHARHPHPAVDHDDPLRHRDRDLDRAALPLRRDPRDPAGAPLLGLRVARHAAREPRAAAQSTSASRCSEKMEGLLRVAPFLLLIVAIALLHVRRPRHALGDRGASAPSSRWSS